MTKSKGRSYDLCLKSSKTRSKLYRTKRVKTQRNAMCSPGYAPRCVRGLAYCTKRPKRSGSKQTKRTRRKSKPLLYLK